MHRGGGPASLQRQYDDFTLSSTGERSEDGANDDGEQSAFYKGDQRFPLKSTLPTHFKRSTAAAPSNSRRAPLPRVWNAEGKTSDRAMAEAGPARPNTVIGGHAYGGSNEDDLTLSTDEGTAADGYFDQKANKERVTTAYEDDSFIPGVGRGVQRGNGNGGASYSAHRDILASSHFAIHPSPSTAARHDQIRASASNHLLNTDTNARHQGHKQRQSSVSSALTSDAEDSESDNETSSTSTTSHALQPMGMLRSKAESTGNHQTLDKSRDDLYIPERPERPRLDAHALDEMDRAAKKGRSLMRQDMLHSPSPASSRQDSPQLLRSKKEDHRGQRRGMPAVREKRREAGGTQAEGSTRKPSDSSSNGRKQAGTTGSTTGETLVEDRGHNGVFVQSAHRLQRGERSPFFKLPSGQKMGQSTVPGSHLFLPDLTGMTSALESPVKTILGVEHRQVIPQNVQARHLQLNEARLDDFNELAHYVKTVERELDQTQRKVQAVEAKSTKCVKEMNALRSEWTSFRDVKSKHRTLGAQKEIVIAEEESAGEEEGEEEEGHEYESKLAAINDHIARLTRDLHTYRETMEQMRAAKEQAERDREKRLADKQRRQQEKKKNAGSHRAVHIRSSSPVKTTLSDGEEDQEEARSEMIVLRKQVNKVAKEVERLRAIVDAEGHRPSAQEESARFSVMKPDFRRSIGVGSSHSPFRKSVQRFSDIPRLSRSVGQATAALPRSSSPVIAVHGLSKGEDDAEEQDVDETVRPVVERIPPPMLLDHDEDLSFVAHQRAERVFEKVDEQGRHDEKDCTVCRGKEKSQKRRQARRERAHQQPLRFVANHGVYEEEDDDGEENLFLSLLDAALNEQQDASKALPTKSKHERIVRRLLKEHMDEFYHHRMLYCELADELKEFSPDLNRVKRKILAEHVMESVEGLEFRATRINILQALIGQGGQAQTGQATVEMAGVAKAAAEGNRRKREKRQTRNSSVLEDHKGEQGRRVLSA